jgi:hypothetical protein
MSEVTDKPTTAARIGVIGLVPAQDFAAFLSALHTRYPEASVTAIIGSSDLQLDGAADEYLQWGSFGARGLVREIRRRRFDLLAVPYNPEYIYTLTYWKTLVLALLARTKGLMFCERAALPESSASLQALGTTRAIAATLLSLAANIIWQPVAYFLREAAIIALSSLLLFVLLGIIVVDGIGAVAGLLTRRGRDRVRGP